MDAVDKIVIIGNHEIAGIQVFAKKAKEESDGGRGRGGRGGGKCVQFNLGYSIQLELFSKVRRNFLHRFLKLLLRPII